MTTRTALRPTRFAPVLLTAALLCLTGCAAVGSSAPADRAGQPPESASSAQFHELPGERTDTEHVTVVLPAGLVARDAVRDDVKGTIRQAFASPDEAQPFPAIAIASDVDAPNSPNDESFLQTTSLSLAGGRDFVRESVEWPGAESGVTTTWTEDLGDVGVVDAYQLMLIDSGGTLVTVTGYALDGQLESSGMLDAVLTAKLR